MSKPWLSNFALSSPNWWLAMTPIGATRLDSGIWQTHALLRDTDNSCQDLKMTGHLIESRKNSQTKDFRIRTIELKTLTHTTWRAAVVLTISTWESVSISDPKSRLNNSKWSEVPWPLSREQANLTSVFLEVVVMLCAINFLQKFRRITKRLLKLVTSLSMGSLLS